MNKKEFLQTKVVNCKSCGNKIKPSIFEDKDMGATLACPTIECRYCSIDAGSFYPEQYDECLLSWSTMNT